MIVLRVVLMLKLMVVRSFGSLLNGAGFPLRSFVILVSTLDTLGISPSAFPHRQLSDSSSGVLALSSHGQVLVFPPPSAPSACLARPASLSHGQFLVLLLVSVILLASTPAASALLAFRTSSPFSSPHGQNSGSPPCTSWAGFSLPLPPAAGTPSAFRTLSGLSFSSPHGKHPFSLSLSLHGQVLASPWSISIASFLSPSSFTFSGSISIVTAVSPSLAPVSTFSGSPSIATLSSTSRLHGQNRWSSTLSLSLSSFSYFLGFTSSSSSISISPADSSPGQALVSPWRGFLLAASSFAWSTSSSAVVSSSPCSSHCQSSGLWDTGWSDHEGSRWCDHDGSW